MAGAGVFAAIVISFGGFSLGQMTQRQFALLGEPESVFAAAPGVGDEIAILLSDPLLDDGPDLFGDGLRWEG